MTVVVGQVRSTSLRMYNTIVLILGMTNTASPYFDLHPPNRRPSPLPMSAESPSSIALPPELLGVILKLLVPADQKAFSLVSRDVRAQVLPELFGHLVYSGLSICPKVRRINEAGKDVKAAVRKLELKATNMTIRAEDDSLIIFVFLSSLPNLHSLTFSQFGQLVPPTAFSRLLASVRHAPLRALDLYTGYAPDFAGPITPGLPGLETLAVSWDVRDSPASPGRSFEQLYALVTPSLETLVSLSIANYAGEPGEDLDLQVLKPAGRTLREFSYTLDGSLDEGILETIPEIFPHLTKLSVNWLTGAGGVQHSVLWTDTHLAPLSRLTNLTDLRLSCDFEQAVDDPVRADDDFPWFIRCYTRRLAATRLVLHAFPRLFRCAWVHHRIGRANKSMEHLFVIEEEGEGEGGEGRGRRVRGVKQWWMGREQEFWVTGDVVSCKLEDLPGDIIGENDSPEEE